MDSKQLHDLAPAEQAMRGFVEAHLIDETGLLYAHLNAATLRPWTNEQVRERGWGLGFYNVARGDAAGQLNYEDSLMATGEYGLSEILRYEATGDAAALGAASFQVSALLRVLYEGALYERGYLPKPHGGMRKAACSHEISVDQYIKVIVAFRAFQPYAGPALQRAIDRHFVDMADYHYNRDFAHPRRESMVVTPENRTHGMSFFIPILQLAYRITGDKKYRDSITRFDAILDELLAGEVPTNSNILSLFLEGFHLARQEGREDRRLTDLIGRLWDARVALCEERGWEYDDCSEQLPTSRVVRIASFAPIVDQYFPDKDACRCVVPLLGSNRKPERMLYSEGDPATLHPLHHYRVDCLCETSISSWLVAYWRMMGKMGGLPGR